MEMTRQRLKESYIKWETTLSLESFSLKIIKKIESSAFSNSKTKIIDAFVPSKVRAYLKLNLKNELDFFEKKYKFKININSEDELTIPEYRIHLKTKNKKLINQIESFSKIREVGTNRINKNNIINIKGKKKKSKNILGKTLWVKKRRRSN